ncbi:MAG TPA: MarR family transcriptional regulator [Gemmatimonadaceae bacterium]|nr:MarR family transcriptional regulator [Gemmatimonadaceae bacterium]
MATSSRKTAQPSRAGRSSAVQAEIRQSRPFRSAAQEATVALMRTASLLGRVMERMVEPHGLSLAQYNALRIVRGAGTGGIPTLAIRERMIAEGTTITRLLDKLEEAGLIRRERALPDRRQVFCIATDAGRTLLDELDPQVDDLDEELVGMLDAEQLDQLIAMLDQIRVGNAERGAPRSAAATSTAPAGRG